jgi:glutamyl-tRNA reductase
MSTDISPIAPPDEIVGLSVPRDVDPHARYADGVRLYDVDALAARAAPAAAMRRAGIPEAERIVDAQLELFEAWRAVGTRRRPARRNAASGPSSPVIVSSDRPGGAPNVR